MWHVGGNVQYEWIERKKMEIKRGGCEEWKGQMNGVKEGAQAMGKERGSWEAYGIQSEKPGCVF